MKLKFPFYVLIVLVILLYHLPYFWLGQDAYYNAFDNLDSYVVWYRSVVQQGYTWAPSSAIIPSFLGGVPKFTLVSTFNLYYLLNIIFTTFHALNILMILASLSGFWGMWLLSRKIFHLDELSSSCLALSFALTPFLPAWGMSISGQPLLLYAILKIRRNEGGRFHWAIVFIFPFVSNFQSAGVFIIAVMSLSMIYDVYNNRSVVPTLKVALTLLILYCCTKLDLLDNLLNGQGFISHRTEITRYALSPYTAFKSFARYFLFGNIDVALSLHTFVILPFVLLTFCVTWVTKKTPDRTLSLFLLAILTICLYVSVLNLRVVVDFRNSIQLLKMFSMERFHIFLQLLWHLCAAQSMVLLSSVPYKKLIVSTVFAGQIFVSFAYQPTYYMYLSRFGFHIEPYQYISRYREYYTINTFQKVKKLIGKPLNTYRVASLGIPPAVSQYNGFYTIDGYSSNYPLPYKQRFKKVIDFELNKNASNKGFFEEWGSQCVLIYDQSGLPFRSQLTKSGSPAYRDIRLNGEALADLHCAYIFSVENILHPELSNLKQIGRVESPLWNVIVYQLTKGQ